MIVCIAEKPSVARDIARILGANRRVGRGTGYMEGNGYQVTWTFGHLCTLKEPHDYRPEWKSWMVQDLPIIPDRFGIKPIEIDNYKEQLEVIRSLMTTATMVVNCGDAGQEGELIQRWVLQYCGCKVPIQRLWISSLTDEAIKEGFAKLRSSDDFKTLYEAGLARAIGDWLLGINATRLYTSRFAQGRGNILSIGRVQTPTLALIVQRQQEIAGFVPEKYWELKTLYRGVTFSAEKGKYDRVEEAEKALQTIIGTDFEIKDVKKKEGKDLPPRLFDLTSLQVACNKKFAMSAEETLATIQTLYERKLTTYPRVDTTYLSDDIYPKVDNILKGLVSYRDITSPLLTGGKLRKSKKVFDNSKVTDHHAIIPTGQPVHGLSDKEQKVFDLIARHFIAAFYPDCIFSTTTVLGQADKVKFKAVGKEILSPGWRTIFTQAGSEPEEDKPGEDKEEGQSLPTFEVGETGPHEPLLKEKQTQPPKLYTEATLLRAMETAGKLVENEELRDAMKENGIGRPSTRANIIETLYKRKYIVKEKRSSIKATEIGVQLIETIQSDILKSAELTGQWEYKLRQIEHGAIEASSFLAELKEMVHTVVWDILRPKPMPPTAPTVVATSPNAPICPKCGRGFIIRGRTCYGCSAYREGCDYRISFEDYAKQYQAYC